MTASGLDEAPEKAGGGTARTAPQKVNKIAGKKRTLLLLGVSTLIMLLKGRGLRLTSTPRARTQPRLLFGQSGYLSTAFCCLTVEKKGVSTALLLFFFFVGVTRFITF